MSILVAILSWWSFVHASEVVVQSPSSLDVEYRAYLAAHAACVTPTEALVRMRPSTAVREKLVHDFADAQKAFLGTDSGLARTKLESLINQIPNQDWSSGDRQVFFKSAMRRAQLAVNDPEMEMWLRHALTIGYEFNPDHTLFPPPLIQRWQQVKQKIQTRKVQVAGLNVDWSQIMINGVSCTADVCPAFPDTDIPVRITWLSDKWQPYTAIIKLSQLPQEIPARRAWVAGECRSPQFDRAANIFRDKQPFFGLDCEKSQATSANLNLTPVSGRLNMFEPPKKERPLYKSPWLWAGVGAVIAIVVAQSQKSQEKKDPSTSYGY